MQKNWHMVYTKPKCERKVAGILTRKKIKHFCPNNRKKITPFRKNKAFSQGILDNYVFIFIEKELLPTVLQIDNVLSIVYWKGIPAVINTEEIEIMQSFLNDYEEIRIEKSTVDYNLSATIIDRPVYRMDGNLLKLKNETIKVSLPSMGYTLVAEIHNKSILSGKSPIFSGEILLQ